MSRRSTAERIADVRRVLTAARAIRSSPTLEAELVKTTGLTAPGVRLALDEHLEVDAEDDALERLVAGAGDVAVVHVVLSANVFVGALRAIALARAAAPRVIVRPSSREPSFAKALVAVMAEPASVSLVPTLDVAAVTEGEIHVYGRDETISAIRMQAHVPVRGHGTGFGLAYVDGDEIEAAAALARDVVPFDQRGCLSPRIAFVRGDAARADIFARALSAELARLEAKVPRGGLSDEERSEASRYRGTMAFAGELYDGPAHAVGVADEITLPPAGRHVHVAPCASAADVARALGPLVRYVAAVGTNVEVPALRAAFAGPRFSQLGAMQRPPLDGPVDMRHAAD